MVVGYAEKGELRNRAYIWKQHDDVINTTRVRELELQLCSENCWDFFRLPVIPFLRCSIPPQQKCKRPCHGLELILQTETESRETACV